MVVIPQNQNGNILTMKQNENEIKLFTYLCPFFSLIKSKSLYLVFIFKSKGAIARSVN